MTAGIFKILSAFRWLMLIFCFGLAVSLCGFSVVFALKVWKFLSIISTIDEIDAVLKLLGMIDYALVAGLIVMVMLSTFSSFVENQDDAAGASWLSSISFGALKIKLASTIAAIGAITLLEGLFETAPMNSINVALGLSTEIVILLVLVAFAYVDHLGSGRSH